MKKQKGNEKLRAVYANAASALTVQFNEIKNHPEKHCPWRKRPPPLKLGSRSRFEHNKNRRISSAC